MMSILVWTFVGLVIGFFTSKRAGESTRSIMIDIVLGVLGATLGGLLFRYQQCADFVEFAPRSILFAIIGAIAALSTRRFVAWLRAF